MKRILDKNGFTFIYFWPLSGKLMTQFTLNWACVHPAWILISYSDLAQYGDMQSVTLCLFSKNNILKYSNLT